jgi:hypothetical protein
MNIFRNLSRSTQRYLGALLVFFFVACTQTPTPDNNTQAEIQISDENNNNATARAIPVNGLKGDYFDNLDFTGNTVTRYDANVNRNWGTAAPITGIANTSYSVRWTGQIQPQFSQEYTFYLTSSGGARLMVNGQVLVNNWTDHASKVDTGKVSLQANVKYDIRLEFYRNTANPAIVKLEWQSASRTRQVVPQARLFTTGSNTAKAIAVITAKFNLALNIQESVLIQSKLQAATLIAPEIGNSNLVFAIIDGNDIALLYKIYKTGNKWTISNLLDNSSTELGEAILYVNSDGSQSETQRKALRLKLLEFVTKKFVGESILIQKGQIRPQSVIQDILCPIPEFLLRPPTCALDDCSGPVNDFMTTACNVIFIPARLFELVIAVGGVVGTTTIPGAQAAAPTAWGIAGAVIADQSDLVGDVIRSLLNGNQVEFFNLVGKWQAYLKCLADHPSTCIRELTALPANDRNKVNASGFLHPSVRNSGVATATGKPVNIDIVKREFTPETVGFTSLSISFIPNTLSPGEEDTFNVFYTCPSTPQVIKGKAKFWHNVQNLPNPIEVSVSVDCYGEPKIEVTPNPLALTLPVGRTKADNYITINNSGNDVLNITGFSYLETQSLTGASFTPNLPNASTASPLQIQPGSNHQIQVPAVCGSVSGTLEGTVTISSNAVGSPSLAVDVSLECTPVALTRTKTLGYIGLTRMSKIGVVTPLACYAVYEYEIWVGVDGTESLSGGIQRQMIEAGSYTTPSFPPCGLDTGQKIKAAWNAFEATKVEKMKGAWRSLIRPNLAYTISDYLTYLFTTSTAPCGQRSWTSSPNVFEWSSCLTFSTN